MIDNSTESVQRTESLFLKWQLFRFVPSQSINLQMTHKMWLKVTVFCFERFRKHCERKRKHDGYHHLLLFPTMFSEAVFLISR